MLPSVLLEIVTPFAPATKIGLSRIEFAPDVFNVFPVINVPLPLVPDETAFAKMPLNAF